MSLSVIVPAYEEQLNIEPLCTRLFAACNKAGLKDVELIIVDDDSGQGTIETEKVVKKLKDKGYNIILRIRRRNEGRGLSSAVVLGMTIAKNSTLLCMDADLQHEPESVPDVAAPIMKGEADFSVGSRNIGGAKTEGFPLIRQLISSVATLMAKPLTPCSDPMSGFFAISKETFERGKSRLNPMGYKIGLELMVRCKCKNIKEVPITFRDREAGESKLSMKQNLLYIQHLAHLYWFKYPVLVILFLILVLLVVIVSLIISIAFITHLDTINVLSMQSWQDSIQDTLFSKVDKEL